MRARARAVVIGGGVRGLLDPLLARSARLEGRRALPSGPISPAARHSTPPASSDSCAGSLSLTRMMMCFRRPVPGARIRSGPRDGAGTRSARCALPRLGGADGGDLPPGRLGEDVWATARADLCGARPRALPADFHRRCFGAAFLPMDGYIDPSQLTFALAEGARRRGAEIHTQTRGDWRSGSSADGSPGS